MKTVKREKIAELVDIQSRINDLKKDKEGKRWKRIEKQELWKIHDDELSLAVKLARDLEHKLGAFDLIEIVELVLKTDEPVEAYIKILGVFGIGVE